MGGYQWYFYDRKWFHLGVALRAHIGYTNYNVKMSDYYTNRGMTFDITAHGIQYGMEAQFIWDFLNIDAHTLGVHIAPLGFEGSTILWSIKGQTDYWNVPGYTTIRLAKWERDTNQTSFAYTFSTGLHYYYDINHQLFMHYKYRYYNGDISTPRLDSFSLVFVPYHTFMVGYAYKF